MKIFYAILAAVLTAMFFCSCSSVPYTGRNQMLLISMEEEKSLGLQSWNETLKDAHDSTDSTAKNITSSVGKNIAAVAGQDSFQWEFRLIDDDATANAFCLPGGKVAVYTGILPFMRNEAELACVVGHEIGHAIARHGNERISQSYIAQGAKELLGLSSKSQYAQAAFGIVAEYGVLLPYSREQEYEADYIGMMLMAKAGYDPDASIAFWTRFSENSGKGSSIEEFFSTHPLSEKRIEKMRENLPAARAEYQKAKKVHGNGSAISYTVKK